MKKTPAIHDAASAFANDIITTDAAFLSPAQIMGSKGGKARTFAKREAGKANLAKARERKKQLALDNKRLL